MTQTSRWVKIHVQQKGTDTSGMCPYLKFKSDTANLENATMSATITKKQRVLNYLSSGKSLTASQAKSRYGVGNLRATMSDIRGLVEGFGNWKIVTDKSRSGMTRYTMVDSHPGKRTYGFDKFGNRYTL